ncbi:MAG: amino acid adenylation domain-containing protein, partial [Planctomycetaceae bacterium]
EETAEGGLTGSLEYATDLYDHETAVRLVRRLQDLLEQVADAPGRRITALSVLLDQEARQLQTWGHGPAPAGDDLDISTLFARQVTANPRGLAVAAGAVGLSYSELDQRVESWARQLADWGVGPETIVAVHLGRTADFVVALLAILRAGGAYLPVDEEVPETRLSQILTAARPVLLLTSRSLSGRCPVDIRTVCVEDLGDSAGLVPVGDWPVAQRDQAAYLIHTSGSTGRPKGIVGRHGTLANLILWQSAGQRPVRVAQFTAVGFDVSPQEILTALLTGGSLHVVDAETRLDPERFIEFLVQERITDLFVPFVVLENLARVALELGRNLPELREVHQAGEALRLSPAIRQFFTAHPGCRLHNHYGPAETHVVTACTLPADPEAWPDQATIGIPISGIQAYVLDDGLEPVPPGVVGELYFAGEGLNRGYLRQPGETAARFVADPRSRAPGGRMYRTGDLARWQLSGDLEFLGRVDHQVKIRGVRVEPGEIEAVLLDEGSIVQAVVVPWNDDEVGTQLAAYVVPRETGRIDEESLVRFLSSRLPTAMIPASIVEVEQIPLTTNGKLDRKALPAPRRTRVATAGECRAPRNPLEAAMCRAFGEILNLPAVGIDDSFFALGGHSLLATRLAARVRRDLGREVPIRVVFEHPTAAGLAAWLESQDPAGHAVRPPLMREERPARLPLSAAQQRMWFLQELQGAQSTYHIPLVRRLRGPLDLDALRMAVGDLLERHEVLRTVFPEEGGIPWQEVREIEPLELPVTVEDVTAEQLEGRLVSAANQP